MKTRPKITDLKIERLDIGSFAFIKPAPSGRRGRIWMQRVKGQHWGEGGEFRVDHLDAVLKKFFRAEF